MRRSRINEIMAEADEFIRSFGFILPPLSEVDHLVESKTLPDGMLFALPAVGLKEQRDERRRTIRERCEKVAALVKESATTGRSIRDHRWRDRPAG